MGILKTIMVTGGTGNQGGAVARSLFKSGFIVKVLTRDPTSIRAQRLAKNGTELLKGDLNDTSTYKHYMQGLDGIFSVQSFEDGVDKEIKQGIGLAKLAKEFKVSHFIYSSVSGADKRTGIPHWDSKIEIENSLVQSGLSYTIVRPASLYENFLIPQVKDRLVKGKLVSPVDKNIIQQFISSADIGRIAAKIFTDPAQYRGCTIPLFAEQMDMAEVAALFSKALGIEVKYQKLPGIITRLAMGKKLYTMFQWINKNGGDVLNNNADLKKVLPDLLSLDEWIRLNFKISTVNP